MKLALSMIFKGTEKPQTIMKCLGSIAPYVDAIYMTATQVNESEAIEVAKSFGAIISYFEWCDDFSKARNFALKQIPDEYEYIMWIDDDDTVIGGEHIKPLLGLDVDRIYMDYHYLVDEKTGAIIQHHPRERIVRKKLFEWGADELPVGALHENLNPKIDTIKDHYTEKVIIRHHMTLNDGTSDTKTQRNLRILEKAYASEKDHDPRTEFYLARAYIEIHEDVKAEKLLWDYLEKSEWDEERAVAYQYLGEIYHRANKHEEALQCFESAKNERFDFPWIYFRIGQVYADMEDWDKCLFYTKIGLDLPYPKTGMPMNPQHDQILAMVNLYMAFFGKRKLKLALGAVNKLLKLKPDSEFWKEKQLFLLEAIKEGELVKNVVDIVQELKAEKKEDQASILLNVLPDSIFQNGLIWSLRHEVSKPFTWGEKDIVYFTGKGAEPWDETSLETGVGGSETAVIHLSQWWRKHGYNVYVYGDPVEGEHRDKYGVNWLPYWKFNYNDNFNILVAWRTTAYTNVKAKKLFVDFHDMVHRMRFDKEIVDKVTGFMCKSEYQKSYIPKEAQEKAIVIPNGFNKSLLVLKPRLHNKIIYTSSYDRGLYEMLKYGWPVIKKEVPDAELHVYYGWNIFDRFFANNKKKQEWKQKMITLMEACGVKDHGRISQQELMSERATASVHWYGTTFTEIDCISVRESAASGVVPVVSDLAVFEQNSRPYTLVVKGNPYDKRTQEAIAREVVAVLKKEHEDKRKLFTELARKEDWETIATEWEKLFV